MNPSVRQVVLFRRATAPFSPLSLFANGETGGFHDVSDLTTLFQLSNGTTAVTANSDPVGYLGDKSGNGNHLIQATAGKRPLYKTSAGLSWLESDGVDDLLTKQYSGSMAQPYTITAAIQQIAWHGGQAEVIGDWATGGGGRILQNGTTPKLQLYAGSIGTAINPAVGSDAVITAFYSGSSSTFTQDGGAPQTGDPGTGATGGLTLFSYGGGDAGFQTNIRVYAALKINRALTVGEQAKMLTWMGARQGRTL